jgi:hypothetical protein
MNGYNACNILDASNNAGSLNVYGGARCFLFRSRDCRVEAGAGPVKMIDGLARRIDLSSVDFGEAELEVGSFRCGFSADGVMMDAWLGGMAMVEQDGYDDRSDRLEQEKHMVSKMRSGVDARGLPGSATQALPRE